MCEAFVQNHPQFESKLRCLFQNTVYFTKECVVTTVVDMVKKYVSERNKDRKLVVLLEGNKIGSQHWLYLHYREFLGEHYFMSKMPHLLTPEDIKLLSESDVLLVDDMSLSGSFFSSLIENIVDLWKTHFNYVVICAIGTENAESALRINSYHKAVINFEFIIKNFAEILEENRIVPSKDFPVYFCPDSEAYTYPVHTEYKIANQFGSYPTIYENCRAPPDRSFMNEVVKHFQIKQQVYVDWRGDEVLLNIIELVKVEKEEKEE